MSKHSSGVVRIISGRWRRQQINFPNTANLRPTPDRVRETLFNWLMNHTRGATCLDLFAGSGALGFEALSRGAKKVIFVDNNKENITAIKKNAERLGTEDYEAIVADLPHQLAALPNMNYDIVFLDPPYHKGLVMPCLQWLSHNALIKPDGLVYVESEIELRSSPLPNGYRIFKEDYTKKISYRLFSHTS